MQAKRGWFYISELGGWDSGVGGGLAHLKSAYDKGIGLAKGRSFSKKEEC